VRWRCLTLPLLCLLAAPLAGQSPQDRLSLDDFRDSLEATRDTTALHALCRALARRAGEDPMAGLRAGYVALRRTALGADRDAGDARALLRRVTASEPGWPYAWHALADAEMRRADWQRADSLALGSRVGSGTIEQALAHERRALAADPAYAPAALTLAALALGLRDTAFYPPARDALRRADLAQPDPSADLLLARGRLERAAGDEDSAAAVFARAGASPAGPAAELARLELARTRFAGDAGGGDSAYYAGAASQDDAVVAAYRADIAPIASGADLARFDGSRGAERAAWLARFWTDRDHVELRGEGERIREHYRRLLYARRHFALTVSRRFYGGRDAYRSGSEELDDRGVIYVRHGEPATRLKPFVFGLMPNETWRYGRADGDLLFHFSAGYDDAGGGDLYDYRLVESVLDLRGAAGAPRDQLLLSRQSLSPMYGQMLNWGRYGAARARGRERGIGRASIDYGTTTDSYELQYARRLTAYADLIAVGARDGLPLAHFVFAVAPLETRPWTSDEGGVVYPVRVRLVAIDAGDHAVARVDTAFDIRLGHALDKGEYLIGRAEMAIPPGRWGWRAAIEQRDDAGVVLPRDTVRVAAIDPGLALSDLALGIPAASARWQSSPGDTVLLTPFPLFLEGSDIELYYEARGTVPATSYRHRIAVYRLRSGGRQESRPVVALGFEERADLGLVRAHRTLQLGRLKPGRYVVEVEVRPPSGPAQSRRREILVVKR
jgi:GWxTD domain-containing protein